MFSAFADAVRHTTSLTNADPNSSLVVANNHDGPEGKAAATLDNFGYALNIDDTFVEFFAIFLAWFLVTVTLGSIVTTAGTVTTRFIAAWFIATGLVTATRSVATAAPRRFLLWLICHFTSTLKF
jgi:hypothetical protein